MSSSEGWAAQNRAQQWKIRSPRRERSAFVGLRPIGGKLNGEAFLSVFRFRKRIPAIKVWGSPPIRRIRFPSIWRNAVFARAITRPRKKARTAASPSTLCGMRSAASLRVSTAFLKPVNTFTLTFISPRRVVHGRACVPGNSHPVDPLLILDTTAQFRERSDHSIRRQVGFLRPVCDGNNQFGETSRRTKLLAGAAGRVKMTEPLVLFRLESPDRMLVQMLRSVDVWTLNWVP